MNFIKATEKDEVTHKYFDALLSQDKKAKDLFRNMYFMAKKSPYQM